MARSQNPRQSLIQIVSTLEVGRSGSQNIEEKTHLRQLRLQNKVGLGRTLEGGLGDVTAILVGSAALVHTRVLLVAVQNVEDDDSEVVERAVPVTVWQLLVVVVPFHLGERINRGGCEIR